MNDRFYRHLVRQSADGGSFTTHQAAFQRHKFSYSTCRWYHFGARIVRQFFKFQQRRINKMSMKEQSKSAVFFPFQSHVHVHFSLSSGASEGIVQRLPPCVGTQGTDGIEFG